MKILSLTLLLLSFNSFAGTTASCDVVNGIYQNSQVSLIDLRFETIVDVFTINNAQTITMNLNGRELRFLRSDLTVRRQTKLIYLMRENGEIKRAINIMLDRTPKEASTEKEFYGNMVISPENENESNLFYNFYCRF